MKTERYQGRDPSHSLGMTPSVPLERSEEGPRLCLFHCRPERAKRRGTCFWFCTASRARSLGHGTGLGM